MVPVVSTYFVAYRAFFLAVAPFFRAKHKPQTGTIKFYDKALCKLAGMKDTVLSAYLHSKATAWYKQFLPSIAQIAPRTPRWPRLTVAMGRGGRPRMRRMLQSARGVTAASESSLDEADDDACNEARSAQLSLLLSDIAWYIGAGCYIPPSVSGVLKLGCYIADVLYSSYIAALLYS